MARTTRPPGGPTVTGAMIAADAARYIGLGYVFGGDASRPGVWDCSSFVSYVLGHDFGLAIPNGRWGEPGFPPYDHGPTVDDYAGWNLATTITAGQAGPGDLICFVGLGPNGHIGIVTGPDQMISALNPTIGTARTPIQGEGPYGAPLVYRRIMGVPAGQAPAPPGVPPQGWPGLSAGTRAFIVALFLAGGIAALTVASAAAAGLVLVGGAAVGRKAAQRNG